jgi:hypothetical protein
MRPAIWTAVVAFHFALLPLSVHGQDETPLPEITVDVPEVALSTDVNAMFTMEIAGSTLGQTFMLTPVEMPPETTTLVQ